MEGHKEVESTDTPLQSPLWSFWLALPVSNTKVLFQLKAVTKTRNGMERNGTERSVIFRLFIQIFRFRVRDPEIEVFGFRAGYCMASRSKSPEKNGTE